MNRFALLIFVSMLAGCSDDSSQLFVKMSEDHTGVNFRNMLVEDSNANVLNYSYFYNGGGVAIGDINNDGLPDILFTGNMVPNRLYLNKGNFTFEDITEKSGIAKQQGWCTGATMVDINGDGKLDIYICRSGDIDPVKRKNLLFINNGVGPDGVPTFTEQAEQYGLADEGYSTQAAFFDYDKDGDLDMILINHSLRQYANSSFVNPALRGQQDPDFAAKLYRNDNGHFTDVSKEAGITSNVLCFGLGLSVSDINNDGWPDIYISNDFNEPDHLFINNGPGPDGKVTFSEQLSDCMDQTSLYSMGNDCADFNNDGFPDLMTLDMQAEDNHTQKMHSGSENFDKFQLLFKQGFYYQYSRNMLQKNNGDGTFSEIGLLAGVSSTNWSWSALFCDFDNDGNKDLFITSGYEKDFTNMDFIKYHVTRAAAGGPIPADELLGKMPSLSLPSYLYRNNGDNTFTKKSREWGFDRNSISSGATYADLDNDGAMDLAVSNINEVAGIYRNQATTLMPTNHFLKVKLQGSPNNTLGIGAKVKVYCKGHLFYQEESPVRGFQSSVDPVLNFGMGPYTSADSVMVIWPDDRMQKLTSVTAGQTLLLKWTAADQRWDYRAHAAVSPASPAPPHAPASPQKTWFQPAQPPAFTHKENDFNDFAVQPLMPAYLSRQGPCLAKGDINKDGREDFFVGGAKGQPGQIFTRQPDGSFLAQPEPAITADSAGEQVAAIFFDADGDGDLDLYIANGGYEFSAHDDALQDHLYLNDGKGHFTRSPNALPDMRFSKSCVKVADINGDGFPDLFVGGRVVPGKYPLSPGSKILLNDGKGRFRDATAEVAPDLQHLGMVTDAVWLDLNKDHREDLVIVGEWMPIKIFINENGKLQDRSAAYIRFPSSGWWNTILAEDFNGHGDSDLVIGNIGLNTIFRASEKEPVSLYYKDFDGNGILDPILCYYIGGISYPAISRDDLVDQLPGLKKKFLEYHAYADATIDSVFSAQTLKDANILKMTLAETIYLENKGPEGFVRKALPQEAQYSPVYAIGAADIDHDGKKDLVLAGNNSWTRIKFGRYRANHGVLLHGNGKGSFTYIPQWQSGLNLRDDIRSLQVIENHWIFGANNTSLKEYTQEPQSPSPQGDLKELFKGPATASQYEPWRKSMQAWREKEKSSLQYTDSGYHRPPLTWANSTFIYAQVMAEDRYLYDPVKRAYTVDRYLNDLRKRYGGLDAVLIWPTYPNIGIDARNQFDLVADMPGGLDGVKQLVTDFKQRGVRVFFPIMIWDKGTRDPGLTIPIAIVKEMKAIGADGLNGDTMFGVTEDFLKATDSLHYPLVLQPELNFNDLKMVEWNQMSWGYFWDYEYSPGVSVPKWLEPRHQVQVTNRWMTDKTNDLQYAFFNGIGYNAWENIWGIWNQVPDRYAETIRRIAAIYRRFPDVWNSSEWQPHIPVLQKGVFATEFPGKDMRIYTFINRDSIDHSGSQIRLPYEQGMEYFDLWNGKKLTPHQSSDQVVLSFPLEPSGFGALLVTRSNLADTALFRFLSEMHNRAATPLKAIPASWHPLPQHLVPSPHSSNKIADTTGMVPIPATDNYLFSSTGTMIEGDELPSAVGVQYPWEQHPSRSTRHRLNIPSFYIDRYPITNKQFKRFIDASHYHPADDHNFLKDWKNKNYPPGWDDKPVTWVSIEDARAYAAWAGKRLPHEWEWQYAGQGNSGRLYPWGDKMDLSRMPQTDSSRNERPPSDVNAFAAGASPFGVMDMVGNVWQWTDEYTDAHTRSAILKGGSYYHPQTSMWYFPQAHELNKYAKYLLLSPGTDRSGTIGFRCVMP